jgi:hypothetical protein
MENRPSALCGAVVLTKPTVPPSLTHCLLDANHNGDHKDAEGNTRKKDPWEPPDSEAEPPKETGVVTETTPITASPSGAAALQYRLGKAQPGASWFVTVPFDEDLKRPVLQVECQIGGTCHGLRVDPEDPQWTDDRIVSEFVRAYEATVEGDGDDLTTVGEWRHEEARQ